jgi:hypothetical protein
MSSDGAESPIERTSSALVWHEASGTAESSVSSAIAGLRKGDELVMSVSVATFTKEG